MVIRFRVGTAYRRTEIQSIDRNAPSVVQSHGEVPTSNKQRRRMLKAAAGRLAALVGTTPASILAADAGALDGMVRALVSGKRSDSRPGDARRLANKVKRLR